MNIIFGKKETKKKEKKYKEIILLNIVFGKKKNKNGLFNLIKEELLSLKKRKKIRLDNQPKSAIKQEDQFEKLEFKKSWRL